MTGGSCVLHLCIKKQDVVDLTDQMVRMKAETHHELDYGTDVSDFARFPDIVGLLSKALQKQNFIIHSNFQGVGVQLSSSGSLSWNTRLSPGNKCTSVCGHVWNRSVHYSQVGSFENSARHLRYESTSFKRKSQRCWSNARAQMSGRTRACGTMLTVDGTGSNRIYVNRFDSKVNSLDCMRTLQKIKSQTFTLTLID